MVLGRIASRLPGRTGAAAGAARAGMAAQQPQLRGPAHQAALGAAAAPATTQAIPPEMTQQLLTSVGSNSQRVALAQSTVSSGAGGGAQIAAAETSASGAGGSAAVNSDASFVIAVVLGSLGLAYASLDEDELAAEQARVEERFAKAGIPMPRGEQDGEVRTALVRHLSYGDPSRTEQLMKLKLSDLILLFTSQSALQGLVSEIAGPMASAYDEERVRAIRTSDEL